MKKIMLGLFVAIGFSACDLNDSPQDYPSCGSYQNMYFASYDLDNNYTIKTMPTTSGVLVVKTQEKMDSFFTPVPPNPAENSLPTAIDFSKNYLIGIFAGPKSNSNYEIKISSILENDCEVVVQFYEKETKENSETSATLNNPYDFVLIPKTEKPIYFNKVSEVKNFVTLGSISNQSPYELYSENNDNIMHYLNVVAGNYDTADYLFESLTKKGNYTDFIKTIPSEILALSGKTKTYGTPDMDDKGVVYFQLNKDGFTTTIYFDSNDTEDQSAEIVAFKKVIKDRITSYKIVATK